MFRFALAALVSLAAVPAVAAQDLEAARAAFERGEQQFAARNYQLALDSFRQSSRLLDGDPRRQTLVRYNVARALEELGRYREARDEFRAYLADAPADAPFRQETEDRVRELDARVANEGSDSEPLVIAGIVTLSVGAALAIAAVPVGVATLDARSGLDEACPGGTCPPSEQARLDDAYTLATATDALWIAGAVVAAGGAVLLGIGLASGAQESGDVSAGAVCVPGTGCVASIGGRL